MIKEKEVENEVKEKEVENEVKEKEVENEVEDKEEEKEVETKRTSQQVFVKCKKWLYSVSLVRQFCQTVIAVGLIIWRAPKLCKSL